MARAVMRLSGLHRQLASVAVLWVLSASLVRSKENPSGLSQRPSSTFPPVAEEAASEGQQQQVAIHSRHEHDAQRFEFDLADGQSPVRALGAPSDATLPSVRCANREEWQGQCRVWSGKTHNRYLVFKKMDPKEGLGGNLRRVAWALNCAITFDLEPVFIGPFLAGHGTDDFGRWMGLTHNPLLAIRDRAGFERATNERVPFPEGNEDAWFREQENRTSVVYKPVPMDVLKIRDWGVPVTPPSSAPRACPYVRQALRNIYWSAPQTRGRCRALLPVDYPLPSGAAVSDTTEHKPEGKRPWVVAVHVRRGDIIRFHRGFRSIPHIYFSAAVKSVLRAIAAIDPAAHVSVIVFSEGPRRLKGFQLHDEHGKPITWDIKSESCADIGLVCRQNVFLHTDVFETFDCLAAADVLVGSNSSFSQAAAAVSTNVKVMIRENEIEQDRVTLEFTAAASSGAVSANEQVEMDTAIADWWYCSGEVQQLTGSDDESLAARRFYQTVDEGLSPP